MKRMCYLAAALVAVSLAASQAAAQVGNGNFELPTVNAGSDIGNWFRFQSGSGLSSDSTAMPHGGVGHLALETIDDGEFAGAYQRLSVPVLPGYEVNFKGWHKSVGSNPVLATSEIKFEWQGTGAEVITSVVPTADYTQFDLTRTAPNNTNGLVVTYAIASFGTGQGAAEVYVDDIEVSVRVPEPATAGMVAMGLVGLARIRRRK